MPKTNEDLNAEVFREMRRDGCTATADLQRQAFVDWQASRYPERYSRLAAHMNKIDPAPAEVTYPYHRCADALVQKLRKAGLMEVSAAKWSLTARGEDFLEHVAASLRAAPDRHGAALPSY